MSDSAIGVSPSHVGICVTDLDKALRFYCDGLGFEKAELHDIGPEWGPSLEVEGSFELDSQFIRLGALAIELLHYRSGGGVSGRPSARRNQVGITHLSFIVDDLDAVVARLVEHGGTLLPATRASIGVQLVFLADPDGTRVELMQMPSA